MKILKGCESMGRLKDLLGSTAAAIYFIFPMSLILLILLITPLMFLSDVGAVRNSGFAGPNSASAMIGASGLVIGLSLLIPPLRKMYRVLPWLYSFTKIFYIDLIILNIGSTILNYGYEVNNTARHTTFYVLMIIQIIACRLAMCLYYKKRPVRDFEEEQPK
jgi:hypothetical protein